MRYRQHRPAYFSMDDPLEEGVVPDTAALLALPWVASWSADPAFIGYRRHHYPYSYEGRGWLVMAQMRGAHWVVAFVDEKPELEDWDNGR